MIIKHSRAVLHASPAMILTRGIFGCKVDGNKPVRHTRAVHTSLGLSEPFTCISTSEQSTAQLAARFAKDLQAGDCYKLTGSVGSGKSVFSRGFIRGAYDDTEMTVSSPTYLLQNIYDELEGPAIHHFDLYRLTEATGTGRLSLSTSFSEAVSLIEWAERLGSEGPPEFMNIAISVLPKTLKTKMLGEEVLPSGLLEGILQSSTADDEDDDDEYEDRNWRVITFFCEGTRHQKIFASVRKTFKRHSINGLKWIPLSSAMTIRRELQYITAEKSS